MMSVGELRRRVDLSSDSAVRTLVANVRVLLDQQYIVTSSGGYSFADPETAEWNNLLAEVAHYDDARLKK